MPVLPKPLRFLYIIYALLLFVALMLPVFIWAVVVSPAGAVRGGNLIYRACMVWADVWFFLIFIRHRNIYEAPVEKNQSCIFIGNHISYLDTPMIVKAVRHPVRPLGKIEMTRIPIFGFIYRNAIVTVDRSSNANRARSVQRLKALLRKDISVLVFPEGTFNETGKPLADFFDGAFRIAIETGTPIRPILFLDTYRRLNYRSLLSFNPGRSRCIFLDEIPVAGLTLADVKALKDQAHEAMWQKLVAYKAPWIK